MTPRTTLAVTVVLLALAADARAGVGQWTPIGPPGGRGYAIAVDPTNPDVVYAAIDATVFKSSDAAAHWTPAGTGLPSESLEALVIDPTLPARIYAGAGSAGVYVSTDAAASWNPASTGLPIPGNEVLDVAVDPATTGTVYAALYEAGVFKSTDAGGSWSASNAGLGSAKVKALAIDPTTPTTLYAGTFQGAFDPAALFKSTDGGATWSPTGLTASTFGIAQMSVSQVVVDPNAPATVYAFGSVLAKSTDGGTTFTRIVLEGVTSDFALDPTNSARLLVGTSDGVFASLDGGLTWDRTSVGLAALLRRRIRALVIDPTNPAVAYAAPSDFSSDGIYKTTDGAVHWTPASVGLPRPTEMVSDVTLSPADPTRVYAGQAGRGVLVSPDATGHWTPQNLGLPGSVRLAIDPVTPDTMYGASAGYGVFKSTDRGTTWSAANTGLTSLSVAIVVIDPITPSTVYAGTYGGVFRSTNSGGSWTAVNAGLTDVHVSALAIDPVTSSTLYVGTTVGVFKSTNAGATWTPTPIVLAGGPNVLGRKVRFLVVDPSAPQTLYVSTLIQTFVFPAAFIPVDDLKKSTDGGASWTLIETGFPDHEPVETLAIDPVTPTTLYAGAFDGVFRSLDGGANWSPFNTGFTHSVLALAIDPSRPSWVYAGTHNGLYRIEGACVVDADCTDGNPCTTDTCNIGDGSCANTAVADGSACDDDDACSAASACDAGFCTALAPPPACDDGIACTDDACSPLGGACVTALRPTGGLCDDGSSCTTGDQCDAGTCGGTPVACNTCFHCGEGLGCVGTPRNGCAGPSAKGSALSLRESDDGRGQIKWAWKGAGTTTKTDFGNPLGATTYALCLYDTDAGTTRILALPSRDNICALDNCWNETNRGYKVKGGYFHTFALSASSSGKGTIRIVGKGLLLANFPPALPLVKDPKVVIQVQREDSPACWEAEYTTSRVSTATHFEAKTP